MRCLCSGPEATLKRKSAWVSKCDACAGNLMRKPTYAMVVPEWHPRGSPKADTAVGWHLWGDGKTHFFIKSERVAETGAYFGRKPDWWGHLN